jgi:uracil-DNA glycosylase
MSIGKDSFYDAGRIAILPMSFCFPGYDAKGADLPPPPVCARKWRPALLSQFPNVVLTILIGDYAQKWHLKTKSSVHSVVADWQVYLPHFLPLPHPSWRNNAWLRKNEWFEAEVVPVLRQKVQEALL